MSEERTVTIKNRKAVLPELPPGNWKLSCPEIMDDVIINNEEIVTYQIPSLFNIDKNGTITSLTSFGQSKLDSGVKEFKVPTYINGIKCKDINDDLLKTLSNYLSNERSIKLPYKLAYVEHIRTTKGIRISGREAYKILFYIDKESIPKSEMSFYLKEDGTYGFGSNATQAAYTGTNSILTIPDYVDDILVTEIGSFALRGCRMLTKVTIPSSVTSIKDNAFTHCLRLSAIGDLSNVTNIGDNAFYNCQQLQSITLGSNLTSIGNGAFENCRALSAITIPNSVITIGNGAFKNALLNTITFSSIASSALTTIGVEAFRSTSISSIQIPSGVTEIKESAFENCRNLQNIDLANVTIVGNNAFARCGNLSSIIIPASVTGIGDYAFVLCSSLTTVNYKGTESQWSSINIGTGNDGLTSATITYNYTG